MTSNKTIFESIKHQTNYGAEYWHARELMPLLGYDTWRRFEESIDRAKESCENAGYKAKEEFLPVPAKTSETGGRPAKDYILSRYACYLIAQNGDPRKIEVAQAQTYFAIKTRQREVDEQLLEDKRRLMLREEMKEHNMKLASAAKESGVVDPIDYAIFQNFGYKGLYAGLDQRDIHEKKGLKKSQKILDHMGSEELAANLFRATQAEAKLRRENVQGKDNANQAHLEVGRKVRQTIQDLGGTMPENLPTPDGVNRAKTRIKKAGKVGKLKGGKE